MKKPNILFAGKDSETVLAGLEKKTDGTEISKLCFLKQVHGAEIHRLTPSWETSNGDGFFSVENNITLVIQTADCMPILGFSRSQNLIFALHAGWRGVADRILPVLIHRLRKENFHTDDLEIHIGPHLQQSSFTVREDAFELLKNSISAKSFTKNPHQVFHSINPKQWKISLSGILKIQLLEELVQPKTLDISKLDTLTDAGFFSFRGGDQKRRNLSFISKP